MSRPFQPGVFGGLEEIVDPEPAPARVPREPAIGSFLYTMTLDPEEEEDVRSVARKVAARYERGQDEKGKPARMKFLPPGRTIYDVNLDGFGAELAVAVHLGLPWNRGRRGKPDVGHNVEVRQSSYDDANLVLHAFDKLSRIYVLAVGRCPTYRLAGWILGAAGAGVGTYYPPGVAAPYRPGITGRASSAGLWIVPQTLLHPLRDLAVRS